jgi:hypothetical protein
MLRHKLINPVCTTTNNVIVKICPHRKGETQNQGRGIVETGGYCWMAARGEDVLVGTL